MELPAVSFRMIIWTSFAGVALYSVLKMLSSTFQRFALQRSVKKHWPSRPYHWFWGHHELINLVRKYPERLVELITSLSKDFSHGTALYIGPFMTFIRVTHKKIFKKFFGGSEEKYPKPDDMYSLFHPWLGSKGLLLLGGKEWQRHRRLLSNSFHFDILRPYAVKMNECSSVLVEKWNSKVSDTDDECANVEVFADFSLMTIDAIMKCLMGFEYNSQTEEEQHQHYVACIHDLTRLINERLRNGNPLIRIDFLYNLTKDGRKFSQTVKEVREYAENLINRRRKEYAEGAEIGAKLGLNRKSQRHYDFLDVLLQAKDQDGCSLTNKEISDEVNTFIFEGHDTTTSAISWACYCLASNPECQEKCFQEIQETIGSKDTVEFDDLNKLTYLTMCIKESLRLYPPVPSIARIPTSDIEVDGKPIQKGLTVVLSVIGAHYDAKNWPEPRKFDPLRFTQENIAQRDSYTYVPFSAGIRNCIGQNFAMNEIKVCLVHVLQAFKLSADEARPPIPLVELIFRAKGGLHLRVKKREEL